MVYLISYDLRDPDRDYPKVSAALETAAEGGYCRPLQSVWLVRSSKSVEQMNDALSGAVDSSDNFLILPVDVHGGFSAKLPRMETDRIKALLR